MAVGRVASARQTVGGKTADSAEGGGVGGGDARGGGEEEEEAPLQAKMLKTKK